MVDIEHDNNNHGLPYVVCGECGHHIGSTQRVWFMNIRDQKINVPGVRVNQYESEGFCSLECLMATVGRSISDEIVGTMDENEYHGKEE